VDVTKRVGRTIMKMQKVAATETVLFRLAQAVLPEGEVLALFGRRVPVRVESTRAAQLRRIAEARRRD